MAINVGRLLIGKPLETKDLPHQAVNRPVGLAVFASDALSSSAYATEEILIILALAGGGAAIFAHSIPIAIAISLLLVIVTFSYRQTIYAYPNGGGAYIVARDNLGEAPAQIAGAALLTDYILTVAVSISSGVAQITSAVPELLDYRVHLAVSIIILMTIINLRGVRESGRIFAVPTYFFLGMMFLTLGMGAYRYFTGNLPEIDPATVEPVHFGATGVVTLFLLLRAFSSGCTALTGIEAISNGITAFKQPRSHNAAVTLVWMSSILIVLFLGITLLAHQIAAIPSEEETIISQIGRAVHGDNSLLHLLMLAGTALILLMAGNTSYADFPRLAALHAGDGFLPRQLTHRGSRLVFSWGIMVLAVCASLLVIVFNARTTALIPLYAVGVFLSFTISQVGMVVRMRNIGKLKPGEVVKGLEVELAYDPYWQRKMFISGFGALCTGVVMLVFAATKFMHGAWFIVMLIPVLVLIFFRIHSHYRRVAMELSVENAQPLMLRSIQSVILVDNVHAETIRLVNFARSMGHPWHAIHIATNPDRVEEVLSKWQERIGEGELKIIESPYRLLAEPVQAYLEKLLAENPDTFIHVIMGHLQMASFWEQMLHQNSALIFNLVLSRLDRVIVTQVPYQIHHNTDAHEAISVESASSLPFIQPGELRQSN